MVLEVAGGEAARLGIVPGMALSHPRLPQAGRLRPATDVRGLARAGSGRVRPDRIVPGREIPLSPAASAARQPQVRA